MINQAPIAVNDTLWIGEDETGSLNLLVNDSDADGDIILIHQVDFPQNGSVRIIGDSTVLYTPDLNIYGKDSLIYTIKDDNNKKSSAWLIVFINPVNDNPVANNSSVELSEDEPLTIDVLANDQDIDSDNLTLLDVTMPAHGTAEISSGKVVYSPSANYSGPDSFEYTITDGELSASALVSLTIDPVNDAPVAGDDTADLPEDGVLTIDVLANDQDIDSENLTLSDVTMPAHGTAEISSGKVVYSPSANYSGPDSFEYTITDGVLISTAMVFVKIIPQNDNPSANNDDFTINEDQEVVFNVLLNDIEIDSDPLSIVNHTNPLHGVLLLSSGTNSFTYIPDSNFFGVDSFIYTVTDPFDATSSAQVNILVIPSNDTPVANDDYISTYEDTPVEINVLLNDVDVENDVLDIAIISLPSNGNLEITEGKTILYIPSKHFNGSDSFSYKCIDPSGAFSEAVVHIENVIAVNDKPVAVYDQYTLNEDESFEFDPRQNDSDVDGDNIFIDIFSNPLKGKAELLNNGNLRYIPNPDYNGKDSISYSITDGKSELVSSYVILDVLPINDPPVAISDKITIIEDTNEFINVLENDKDIDNDEIFVDGVVIPPLHGKVNIIGNQIEFLPNQDFTGKDSLSYSIRDVFGSKAEAWVFINQIIPVNDAPVAKDDFINTNEDTPVEIQVLVNDYDVDGDMLFVLSVAQPVNGSVEILSDNSLKYIPKSNYYGSDQFEYTVSDSLGKKDSAMVYILSIAPVNDAPVARDDFISTTEDEKIKILVLNNDSDIDEDKISIIYVHKPENGQVKIEKGAKIEYDPDKDFNGLDKFWYVIEDKLKLLDTAWVTVYVGEVNDDPVTNFDWLGLEEDHSATINVLENDYDPDGDPLEIIEITTPFHGSASIHNTSNIKYIPIENYHGKDSLQYTVYDGNGNTVIDWLYISVTSVNDAPQALNDNAVGLEDSVVIVPVLENDADLDGDKFFIESWSKGKNGDISKESESLIYKPKENFNGTDRFTYTISDGELSSTAEVFINIQMWNDDPVAVNDTVSTLEDQEVIIYILKNDFDIDGDPLKFNIVEEPARGSVSIQKDWILYTPDDDFEGVDQFKYIIDDNNGSKDEAYVFITINGQEDMPVATNDYVSIPEDSLIKVDVLANDFDVDGSALQLVDFSESSFGEVSSVDNRWLFYIPKPNFNGYDTVYYSITDNEGLQDSAVLIISVLPVNDIPIAINDDFIIKEDETTLFSPLLNDVDVDQDLLLISSFSEGSHGVTTLDSDKISYTPTQNYIGNDTIIYSIIDPFGETSTAIIVITVTNVNDPPEANHDFFTMDEDSKIKLEVLENDSDPENEILIIQSFSEAKNGSVQLENDYLIYTPFDNYFGNDSLKYYVFDGNKIDSAWVFVSVIPVNDKPVAQNVNLVLFEDESLKINFSSLVEDVDSESLKLSFWNRPAKGQILPDADMNLIYLPDKNENGKDTIQYLITDGELLSDTASVYLEIYPVNDIPVALNDTVKGREDEPIIINVLQNDYDAEGSELSIFSLNKPYHGKAVINSDKSITYTPDINFFGEDEFNYTLIDDFGAKSAAIVFINKIEPVNDIPQAVADTFFLSGLQKLSGNLLTNDFDVDDDEVKVSQIIHQPVNGRLSVQANGIFEYFPDSTADGTDEFIYEISDGSGTAQAKVFISFTSENQSITLFTVEDRPLSIVLSEHASIGTRLNRVLRSPGQGVLDIANDSISMKYTPMAGFIGDDQFKVLVCNPESSSECVFLNYSIKVLPREELLIYQVITPNNDGYNDFWYIEGIKAFPYNVVEIFDLEGNLIYSQTGYDNESLRWEGQYSVGNNMNSKKTGGGTYIYFIDLGNGTTFNGTLLIAY